MVFQFRAQAFRQAISRPQTRQTFDSGTGALKTWAQRSVMALVSSSQVLPLGMAPVDSTTSQSRGAR